MNKRLAVTLGFCALSFALLFVLYKGFGRDPHEVPFMLRGKPAPKFLLKRMDTGEFVKLEQFKGRPLVINFWASWCGPCRSEHPVLEWAGRNLDDQATFLGVVFEDTEDNAKAFLQQYGTPNYPQLIDPQSSVAVGYGVSGVPETYFIDANGVIVDKHVGPISQGAMLEQLQKLRAPQAATVQTQP